MAPNTDSLNGHEAATSEKHQEAPKDGDSTSQASKNPPSRTRTPEPQRDRQAEAAMTDTPGIPDTPESFDWEDFERRYETALRNADENEQQILKEVESLSAVRFTHNRLPVLAIDRIAVLQGLGICCFGP